MRDMAFWGCFVGEVWLSATYGRPSAIDEATCGQHQENQFKFLDAALGRWFYTLPNWLKFEEMAQDVKGSFLGSIGGEMHTLFWTVLILLHSRNLTMFTSNHLPINNIDEETRISSQAICFHAATILLHWLDVLMNSVSDFFEQSCTALFSIAPAIRVLSWTAQKGDEKAASMVQRLKEIKNQVREIARRRFGGEGRLDGEMTLKNLLISAKEEETKNAQQIKSENGFTLFEFDEHDNYFSHTTTNNNGNKGRKHSYNRRKNNMSTYLPDNINNFNFTFSIDGFNNNFQNKVV
ncbi:10626_t:CDS:2 [Entrophospora sp. SA101]|nr:10626_t:CDS:2 [Entrophospora sp. SA101]